MPGEPFKSARMKSDAMHSMKPLSKSRSSSRASSREKLHRISREPSKATISRHPSKLGLSSREGSKLKLISAENSYDRDELDFDQLDSEEDTSSSATSMFGNVVRRLQSKQSSSQDSDESSSDHLPDIGSSDSLAQTRQYNDDQTTVALKNRKRTNRNRKKAVLKLTHSQIELLGKTTGEFQGPTDAYKRFLLGGVQIRRASIHLIGNGPVVGPAAAYTKRFGRGYSPSQPETQSPARVKRQTLDELRL